MLLLLFELPFTQKLFPRSHVVASDEKVTCNSGADRFCPIRGLPSERRLRHTTTTHTTGQLEADPHKMATHMRH
jgi:hypothetical protein